MTYNLRRAVKMDVGDVVVFDELNFERKFGVKSLLDVIVVSIGEDLAEVRPVECPDLLWVVPTKSLTPKKAVR